MIKIFTGTDLPTLTEKVNEFIREDKDAFVINFIGVPIKDTIKYTYLLEYGYTSEYVTMSKKEYQELLEKASHYDDLCD